MEPDNHEENSIHLSDYLGVLLAHRGTIAVFFLITVSVTAFFTYTATPIYQAAAKLVIGSNAKSSSLSGRVEGYESFYAEEMNFNTHFKLITSKPVLKLVAQAIDLDANARDTLPAMGFFKAYVSRVKDNLSLIKSTVKEYIKGMLPAALEPGYPIPEAPVDNTLDRLLSRITITPVESTRIMEISVMDPDPDQARRIANTLAAKYIEFDLASRLKSSTDKLSWMTNELYSVKKRLEDAERDFMAFRQDNSIFSLEGQQGIINQKIADFNTKYLNAKNERMELDTRLGALAAALKSGEDLLQVKALVDNPVVKNLYGMLMEQELESQQLSKVFKPKHPKIREILSKIDATRNKLRVELAKELDSLKTRQKMLVTRENEMKRNIQEFQEDALKADEKGLDYNILQRNVNTSQYLYDTLLSQIKESNILKTGESSNLRIVEEADVPQNPVKPNKKRNMLLSMLLGLFGGAGLAFFFEYLDQSIRNEEDAEKYTGYPVLAVVPDAAITPTGGTY